MFERYDWTSNDPKIEVQVHNIIAKLARGTERIKVGHRVKYLNPEGEEKEVHLSDAKRRRLERELRFLGYGSPVH